MDEQLIEPAGAKKKRPARRRRYNVTPEEFVYTWQTSPSAVEAARAMGMPVTTCQQRASAYRKRGVNLKEMPRKNAKAIDVAGLNRILENGANVGRPAE